MLADRSEDLVEIDAFLLRVPLGDEASLVTIDVAVSVALELVSPPVLHEFSITAQKDELNPMKAGNKRGLSGLN